MLMRLKGDRHSSMWVNFSAVKYIEVEQDVTTIHFMDGTAEKIEEDFGTMESRLYREMEWYAKMME